MAYVERGPERDIRNMEETVSSLMNFQSTWGKKKLHFVTVFEMLHSEYLTHFKLSK